MSAAAAAAAAAALAAAVFPRLPWLTWALSVSVPAQNPTHAIRQLQEELAFAAAHEDALLTKAWLLSLTPANRKLALAKVPAPVIWHLAAHALEDVGAGPSPTLSDEDLVALKLAVQTKLDWLVVSYNREFDRDVLDGGLYEVDGVMNEDEEDEELDQKESEDENEEEDEEDELLDDDQDMDDGDDNFEEGTSSVDPDLT